MLRRLMPMVDRLCSWRSTEAASGRRGSAMQMTPTSWPEAGQGQHQAVGESKQDQSKRHAFSSWPAGASGPSWSASIIR